MNYVDAYEARLARETETRERQQLAALQAKYLGSPEASCDLCRAGCPILPLWVSKSKGKHGIQRQLLWRH